MKNIKENIPLKLEKTEVVFIENSKVLEENFY